MKKITGNLITLALAGEYDVIAHGCNCQCTMKAGIAPQMAKVFGCNHFELESSVYKGHIDKLGRIDFERLEFKDSKEYYFRVAVVNCYTQFNYGKNHIDGVDHPLDYEALILCMRKLNHMFRGQRIGLPYIGCGLGKGDRIRVEDIIKKELADCEVTLIEYDNS